MFELTVPAIVAGLAAAAAAPAAMHLAKIDDFNMPIPADGPNEAALITAVLADPSEYRKAVLLVPEVFQYAPRRHLWAAFARLETPCTDSDHIAEAERNDVRPVELAMSSDGLLATLREEFPGGAVRDELDLLADAEPPADFLRVGRRVLAAYEDLPLSGRSTFSETGVRDTPLSRHIAPRPDTHTGVLAGLLAVAVTLCSATVAAGWPTAIAIAVFAVACAVFAITDLDTMYVSTVPIAVGGVAAVALATIDVPAGERSSRLAAAAITGVGVPLLFWAFAGVWKRIRNLSFGVGFGDIAVLIPSIALPVVATGDPSFGTRVILVTSVLAVAGNLVVFALKRSRGESVKLNGAFPLVPFLACGWAVTWILWGALQ